MKVCDTCFKLHSDNPPNQPCATSFNIGDIIDCFVSVYGDDVPFNASSAHIQFLIIDADIDNVIEVYEYDYDIDPSWTWAWFACGPIDADYIGQQTALGNVKLETIVTIGSHRYTCTSPITTFPAGTPHGKITRFDVPSSANHNDTVTINYEVQNDGDGPGYLAIQIYISPADRNDYEQIYEHATYKLYPGDTYSSSVDFTMPNYDTKVLIKVWHMKVTQDEWVFDEEQIKTITLTSACPQPVFSSFTINPDPPVEDTDLTITAVLEDEPLAVDRAITITVTNQTKDETYFNDYVDIIDNTATVTVHIPPDTSNDILYISSYAWNKCAGDVWSDYAYTYISTTISSLNLVTLTVTVTDGVNPIPEANIKLVHADTIQECTTDNNGVCTFSVFPNTDYSILVSKEGYTCTNCGDFTTLSTDQELTIILSATTCDKHLIIFEPVRELDEGEALVLTGKAPNVLDTDATVKIIFTLPDGSTDTRELGTTTPCTYMNFNATFPYSENLYGNWKADLYNDDNYIETVYLQIMKPTEFPSYVLPLSLVAILASELTGGYLIWRSQTT